MVKRSLQASPPGIQQAKRAFALKGWTQENLAGEIGLKTRQSVWRFFTGQPVERQVFQEICSILDLNWRDIAIDPPAEFPEPGFSDRMPVADIDVLVRQVRSQRQDKIQDQCGTLQLVDVSYPVRINDVYVDVNVLEKIPSQQWLELADLQYCTLKEFDQVGLEEFSQTQISGIKAVEIYSKLRVLGKPGAGKTTFLQHLAMQCNQGRFAANRVPIFVTLRDFADDSREISEFNLLNYIHEEFLSSKIADPSVLTTLLRDGRVLLLLDGVDEVLAQERRVVIKEIRRFSEKYQQNLFVVTCRTAAKALNLQRFTDVEIAPFTSEQIATFAQKWFTAFTKIPNQTGQEQAVQFIQRLNSLENTSFRRLAVTPLFLHPACLVFHLQGRFPAQKLEFYKQCLDLLLSKWDETRGIQRDEIHQGFSLPQKIKLLSQIATVTFEQGIHFFDQQAIEQHINDYIRELPHASTEPVELQLDSEAILKAIDLQHGILTERVQGIFSFSDQSFQEYLTARQIVASANLQTNDRELEQLVCHLNDPRWREIFLSTTSMLRSADTLVQLMKQQIDAIVGDDPHLQTFLAWTGQESLATLPQPGAMRAFYFALTSKPHLVPHFALSTPLNQRLFLDIMLDDLMLKCNIESRADFIFAQACIDSLNTALIMVFDVRFYQALQSLKNQVPDLVPDLADSREKFQTWWRANACDWIDELRSKIIKYRNTQPEWNFSPEQQEKLRQYYDANQLLLDCLNSNCEVTGTVRRELESAILLP